MLFKKKIVNNVEIITLFNWKVFILPRVAELLIHKEKQRDCPLLDANKQRPFVKKQKINKIKIYIPIFYLSCII